MYKNLTKRKFSLFSCYKLQINKLFFKISNQTWQDWWDAVMLTGKLIFSGFPKQGFYWEKFSNYFFFFFFGQEYGWWLKVEICFRCRHLLTENSTNNGRHFNRLWLWTWLAWCSTKPGAVWNIWIWNISHWFRASSRGSPFGQSFGWTLFFFGEILGEIRKKISFLNFKRVWFLKRRKF